LGKSEKPEKGGGVLKSVRASKPHKGQVAYMGGKEPLWGRAQGCLRRNGKGFKKVC